MRFHRMGLRDAPRGCTAFDDQYEAKPQAFRHVLIIARDNGEGSANRAYPEGQKRTDWFHDIAKFKRVYKIEKTDANVGGPMRKIGYTDLLDIADPNKLVRKPLNDGVLKFPFFTVENVDVVDATHIVVDNYNNLPFSSSRESNKADDNELILLRTKLSRSHCSA